MTAGEPMRVLVGYGVALIVLIILDVIWLRYANNAIWQPEVGQMLTENPNFVAAGLFYAFFAAGLVFFAVLPGLRDGKIVTALLDGAFLGFLAYMTFDLTSLAVLKHWSVKVAIVDICWGTFASAVTAAVAYSAAARV